METLLDLKADANRSTKAGLLPLHVAVQNNHIRFDWLHEYKMLAILLPLCLILFTHLVSPESCLC